MRSKAVQDWRCSTICLTVEGTHSESAAQLAAATPEEDDDGDYRLADLRAQVNPDDVHRIVDTPLFYLRNQADTTAKQPVVDLVRRFIQKVVIAKIPGHQPATLEVHGRITSIPASMEASSVLEERLSVLNPHDDLVRQVTGDHAVEQKEKSSSTLTRRSFPSYERSRSRGAIAHPGNAKTPQRLRLRGFCK